MMLKLAKLGIAIAVLATLIVPAAYAGVPDVTQSYFVPQSGSTSTPTEGTGAIANARRCPNDDGTQVLKNNARLKVVVRASDGTPISGIAASDICVLFNGGTAAQGFSGVGDDSIIANSTYNPLAGCPNVTCVQADAATDALGVTYITWIGAGGVRDSGRKWGGYAGDIPVMVLGFKLTGWLTEAAAIARTPSTGNYTAHVKSLDFVGGGTTTLNVGELVDALDKNPVQAAAGVLCTSQVGSAYKYHMDFDNSGCVDAIDRNFIVAHNGHKCNSPLSP